MTQVINQPVAITALSFRQKGSLESFPRRMEFDEKSYTFLDGLQCLIKKGQDVVRIFDMTDGESHFRLRLSDQNDWTLMAIQRNI
ncbi:MAG TPA: hypothetical protein VH144_02950 [Candidatus Saccharimonadales bacterium]|jgi:hypothetical protein|nr:hypothetical protein [Candidatus Saccharimonadales bacterium]